MGKTKHRKGHKEKLKKYKSNKKIEQELLKKKLMEQYMQMQKDAIANKESHTSTEEVHGPEIDLDALNEIEDWEPITDDNTNIDVDLDVNLDVNLDEEINVENSEKNDNNN